MIQAFIYRFLKRRHFWRYASFDEVAELYASRTMRTLAQQMIGLFIALYLYQQGYSLQFIAVFFTLNFGVRIFLAYPAAKYVAKFGPKHGILFGNLLYIPALIFFTLVPDYGLPVLVAFAVFQSVSMVLYDLAYMVDFSKVKHADHAGKEIGYMQILERLTASISPFIGGAIAYVISPEATMWLSAIFFAIAALPLLRTKEQVRLNQHLTFRGFPLRQTWRTLVAETAVGFDGFSSLGVWALFLSIVVLGTTTNQVYLVIGLFASVTIVTSLIAAYWFGRIIDWRHGGDLLKVATIMNSTTHLFRPFVTTPAGIVATNISNDIATTGYGMAFIRGLFDTADDAKGFRIAYMCCVSMALNFGATLSALTLLILTNVMPDDSSALRLFFVVAGSYVLIALVARFRLYR
ncbi:MAG: MFS transporter [Candidatus Saccharimonadales bacterium]